MTNKENTLRARSLRGIYNLFYWIGRLVIPAALVVAGVLAILTAFGVLPWAGDRAA